MRIPFLIGLIAAVMLVGCSSGSKALKTLSSSDDPAARAAAATELGQGDYSDERRPEVVAALRDATLDPAVEVRTAAVEALAAVGGDEATEALIAVVNGNHYARATLEQIEKVDAHVPEVYLTEAQAQMALGNLDEAAKALDRADDALEDADPQTAMQNYYQLKFAYDNLRMRFSDAGRNDQALALQKKGDAVQEKLDELQQQGGGMGLPPGMSFPGGMGGGGPITIP